MIQQANINCLVMIDNVIVAGMEGGYTSISRDYGETWEPLPRGLNSGSTSDDILTLASSR